eukprot:9980609-Karenia_brevis.AAC.1
MYCRHGGGFGEEIDCNHTPVISPGGGQGLQVLRTCNDSHNVDNVADATFEGDESDADATGIGSNAGDLAAELDISGCDQLRKSILKSQFQMWSRDDICSLDVKLHPA